MELVKQLFTFEQIFERPLILGASVSADYLSNSPGKRLALRYTDKKNIRIIAKNGCPGRETVKLIHETDLKDRTVAIGIDLFFWDSTLPSPQTSLHALHKFDQMMTEHRIPYVIGDIPELLPGWQQSRKEIQNEIHKLAKENPLCHLFSLDHLYKEVLRDGYIHYKGRQHQLWELIPDGLHIGDLAGNYLADKIAELLKSPRD